jgi:molybdopterin-synthase adenylyltransferase
LVPVPTLGVRIEVTESAVDIFGRVQMLAPEQPCLVCSGVLDPALVRRDLMNDFERQQDPYISGALVAQPAVISVNTTMAGLAVTMFLAAVTNLDLKPRYQLYRARNGTVRSVMAEADPECVVCSTHGAYKRGDSWPLPGRVTA